MGNLYINRHAQKQKLDEGLFGDGNPPLTPEGERQATDLVARYEGVDLDLIISGTGLRHVSSLRHLAEDRELTPQPDERLNEWYDKSLKGFDYSDIKNPIKALHEDERFRGPLDQAREEADSFLSELEEGLNILILTSQIKGAIMMQSMIGSPLGYNDGEFLTLMLESAEVYHFTFKSGVYAPVRRVGVSESIQ